MRTLKLKESIYGLTVCRFSFVDVKFQLKSPYCFIIEPWIFISCLLHSYSSNAIAYGLQSGSCYTPAVMGP